MNKAWIVPWAHFEKDEKKIEFPKRSMPRRRTGSYLRRGIRKSKKPKVE